MGSVDDTHEELCTTEGAALSGPVCYSLMVKETVKSCDFHAVFQIRGRYIFNCVKQ